MEFVQLIDKLEKFSKVINKAVIGISIVEAILVIAIGIASNNINTDDLTVNRVSLLLLLFLGGLYLLLVFIRAIYSVSFPSSITNELKSERKLQELEKDVERQNQVSGFLVESIKKLNGQTCSLSNTPTDSLCDQGIQIGLRDLLESLIEHTYFLLATNHTKFTIGVYLNEYYTKNIGIDRGIIILDDGLNKNSHLIKNLLEYEKISGELLELQSIVRRSFYNMQYVQTDYLNLNEEFTVICSPMPTACNENDMLGVFFIISKKLKNIPSDLPIKLTMFTRVVSNWVFRYNQCVFERLQREEGTTEVPQVIIQSGLDRIRETPKVVDITSEIRKG